MPSGAKKKPTAVEINKSIKVDRYYICPGTASITFYIPVRDKKGNFVPELDFRGNHKYNGAEPIYKVELLKFEQMSTQKHIDSKVKNTCSFMLSADDIRYDDKLEVLEKMRLDPSNMVMDPEMYDEWRNPEAAAASLENRKYREEIDRRDDVILSLQKEASRLQEMLSKKNNRDG